MNRRAPHHKGNRGPREPVTTETIAPTRVVDGEALLQLARRFGAEEGLPTNPEDWTPEVADAFVAMMRHTLDKLERDRARLEETIRRGRREYGVAKRSLLGAAGTLEKAIADPHGFEVERLRDAHATVLEYAEHLRVAVMAVKKMKRPPGRPRSKDSPSDRTAALLKAIEKAAGLTEN